MCDIHKLKLNYPKCDNHDIAVLVHHKDEDIEICHKCWNKLSENDKFYGILEPVNV